MFVIASNIAHSQLHGLIILDRRRLGTDLNQNMVAIRTRSANGSVFPLTPTSVTML
jgi:hypothetical protein